MKKITTVLSVLLSLALFSCQKEVDSSILTSPGTGNNTGGNTGGYQPLTSGSWWKYKDSTSGGFSTLTAINYTKTISNILYRGVISSPSQQSDTAYQAAPAPNYYMYQKGFSPNTGAPYDLLFNYLNDTASVGYQWSYVAGSGNGFTAHHTVTIIEKGITLNVSGHNYTDVIHTRLDFSYDLGMIMNLGVYDFYTAKNIGIVKVRAEIGGFGSFVKTCSDLVDYHIQ